MEQRMVAKLRAELGANATSSDDTWAQGTSGEPTTDCIIGKYCVRLDNALCKPDCPSTKLEGACPWHSKNSPMGKLLRRKEKQPQKANEGMSGNSMEALLQFMQQAKMDRQR